MKTKFFIGYLVALMSSTVLAQDFSVVGPQMEVTIDGQIYTAQSGGITLLMHNSSNTMDSQPLVWNDGTELTEDEYLSLKLGELDVPTMYKAIRETFTEEEFNELKAGKDRIEVGLQISPEGDVLEVSWYVKISPRTLALFPARVKVFEDNIKKYVKFSQEADCLRLPSWRSFHQINFGDLGCLYIKANRDPDFDGVAIDGL